MIIDIATTPSDVVASRSKRALEYRHRDRSAGLGRIDLLRTLNIVALLHSNDVRNNVKCATSHSSPLEYM
jgi:hypothetical protein